MCQVRSAPAHLLPLRRHKMPGWHIGRLTPGHRVPLCVSGLHPKHSRMSQLQRSPQHGRGAKRSPLALTEGRLG